MNGTPMATHTTTSCSIPKIDAVSNGEDKISRIDNGSIVNNRPPIASHQSPARASFAWCNEERAGIAAKNVGTRTSAPISLPSSAKSTNIDAIKGKPRESNGHIVRRSKVDDQRETEVSASVVESCGLSLAS